MGIVQRIFNWTGLAIKNIFRINEGTTEQYDDNTTACSRCPTDFTHIFTNQAGLLGQKSAWLESVQSQQRNHKAIQWHRFAQVCFTTLDRGSISKLFRYVRTPVKGQVLRREKQDRAILLSKPDCWLWTRPSLRLLRMPEYQLYKLCEKNAWFCKRKHVVLEKFVIWKNTDLKYIYQWFWSNIRDDRWKYCEHHQILGWSKWECFR